MYHEGKGEQGEEIFYSFLSFSLCFRVDISDTLMYVYEMLGAELLSNLYDKLGRLLTNADQPTSWQVRNHSNICMYALQTPR